LFWRFWGSLSLLKRFPQLARIGKKLYGAALTDIFAKNMTFITKRDIYNVISTILPR
jgi:hypothetical protein